MHLSRRATATQSPIYTGLHAHTFHAFEWDMLFSSVQYVNTAVRVVCLVDDDCMVVYRAGTDM